MTYDPHRDEPGTWGELCDWIAARLEPGETVSDGHFRLGRVSDGGWACEHSRVHLDSRPEIVREFRAHLHRIEAVYAGGER